MKTKYFIALFILSTVSAVNAWSQPEIVSGYYDSTNDWLVFEWNTPKYGVRKSILDSGNKVKPVIHAGVSRDRISASFIYSFEVSNLPGAVQLLDNIYVNHPAAISEAKAPAPQAEWGMGEYQNKGIWNWTKVQGQLDGIPAGQTAKGFSFKSKGLPTIVDSRFSGKRRSEYFVPGDSDPKGVDESFDRVFANLESRYPDKFLDTLTLKTIGPIDPPAVFNAVTFIDDIMSLGKQAYQLGWIIDEGEKSGEKHEREEEPKHGIVVSLKTKFLHAQNALQANKTKEAIEKLRSVIHEVDALYKEDREHEKEKKKEKEREHAHITSEAYALLKYNTLYVVDKLVASLPKDSDEKEKHEKKERHDKD